MMFPIESLLQENLTLISLLGALVIGVGFGFVLERVGFGRANILVAQFYGTNMQVFRVMFTAVVTASVGVGLLSALGLLDLKALTINYPTFIWPMLVGGLLVGAGFVIGGYCPGTSVVAMASGKIDGFFVILGVVFGTVIYAELEPSLREFNNSGKMGGYFLYKLMNVSHLTLALMVVVVAALCFWGAGIIEKKINAKKK